MPASTNSHSQETVSAAYADLRRVPAKPLAILVASCALVAGSYSELILGYLNQFASIYSFCFLVLLFALLLPGRLFLLSIPLAVGALRGLNYLNELKIAGVYLPITFFDVKAVLADPMVLVNAVGIRNDLDIILSIAFLLFAFALVASAFYKRNGYSFLDSLRLSRSRRKIRTRSVSFVWNAVTLLVLVIAAQICLARYGRFVHTNLNTKDTKLWRELWLPQTQVTLSRDLGILEYVAFSFAADEGADVSFDHEPIPTSSEVRRAAARFVNSPGHTSKSLSPNIVFFHAESTFDPALAFRLSAPIQLPLWSKQAETRALGPLHVNVIGGGSWVSEFEVVTGIDSRFFGYQGYYTHFYIAPKVKNSFVRYLARKGYETAVFYPIEGSFYNAASAFGHYGFAEFVDGTALRLPPDWGNLIDRDIIKAVIERGAFKSAGPFFYFISTSENHGPHPCRSFATDHQFLTTFAAKTTFEKNCQLNEYLKRATSTSDAFEAVLNQLRKIEQETGRPFVLLVYGDHQPWSFTEGVYSVAGGTAVDEGYNSFADLRTSADGYQTFFHLLASNQRVVRTSFPKPPPVSLLPTLASAFVATSHDDLYLPINFLAFAQCGTDIRASGCKRYAGISWGSHLRNR
jgi:phosphoglycerol transferase MdoB-like AlkP superfamily enzyme